MRIFVSEGLIHDFATFKSQRCLMLLDSQVWVDRAQEICCTLVGNFPLAGRFLRNFGADPYGREATTERAPEEFEDGEICRTQARIQDSGILVLRDMDSDVAFSIKQTGEISSQFHFQARDLLTGHIA